MSSSGAEAARAQAQRAKVIEAEGGVTANGRRLFRRALVGVVAALLVVVLVIGARSVSWLLEPNRYASVRSIEQNTSYRATALLAAAWQLPVAATYRRQPYEFQENQSFCGPASIADVLHSIGDARTQDAVIRGSRYKTWFGILLGGLTLDQLSDLVALRTGRSVKLERNLTLPQFRSELAHANDPERRMIVNFHRGPMFGRGHGHFSPVLGYLVGRDLVLVGDVNPNYRPFLVSSARLWQAIDTVDPATKLKRGLLVIAVGRPDATVGLES